MALSDSKRASEYDYQMGLGTYNNNTDVFKWVIITDSYTAIDEDAVAIGICFSRSVST